MTKSKKLLLLTLAAVMALTFAFAVSANAKMVKKVDNFILFVDQSGSMGMTHNGMGEKKIDMALNNIKALNKVIPELDYNSAMFLFAPFKAQCAPKPYNPATLAAAADAVDTDFDIYGRTTPMGMGMADIDPVIAGMSGKTALIIFTDGNSNIGADPVAKAQQLANKYGSTLCVHVVSYADTAHGQAVVDGIRQAFPCSVSADAASLMDSAALGQFAKDVFYKEVADPAPAPAPAPAPVPAAKEVISFSLNFGFDKYMITDEMIPVLEQAKMILDEDPQAMYEISGHTDSTGTDAYNQGLSERRAASVKNWMIANGIDTGRLEAKGYGESNPKYDNTTKEGRKLNRRVEIQTK